MSEPLSTLVDTLEYYREHPIEFVEDVLGGKPYEWQKEFLEAVLTNDKLAIRSGRQIGKTTVLAWLVFWFLLTNLDVKIGISAPTAGQIDGGVWANLRTIHRQMKPEFSSLLELTSSKLYLKGMEGENFAVAKTASKDNPESLLGLNAPNIMFLIDEASGVDGATLNAAMGSMNGINSKMILTSNPTRNEGYFYDIFTKWTELWWTRKISIFDLIVDRGEEAVNKQAANFKDQYGEDSNQYITFVLGEFPEAGNNALLARHIVESAVTREVETIHTAPVVWGLDVARSGGDRTALCKRQGNTILEKIQTKDRYDTMQVAGWVLAPNKP